MNIDFTKRYLKEESSQIGFWSLNKKIGAVVAVIIFTVILFNTTGCTQKEDDIELVTSTEVEELPKDTVKVGNDGVNAAIAPDEPVKPLEAKKEEDKENEILMVSMSVENTGRMDPFLPESESYNAAASHTKLGYDLLPPPTAVTTDSEAAEVMATRVSGIMYDRYNPSAILKIDSSDYLVRSGDIINGYKVLSIAKAYVAVQKGANIYKAGVGEMLTTGEINYNTVSNLENKFGGRNNIVNKK